MKSSMNTQDILISDDVDSALLHIGFVDKAMDIVFTNKDSQYDFTLQPETLVGLYAMYKEHCRMVDDKEKRLER